jgi:hypothetical protein
VHSNRELMIARVACVAGCRTLGSRFDSWLAQLFCWLRHFAEDFCMALFGPCVARVGHILACLAKFQRRFCGNHLEGPIRRTREGWSEWEPIKILLEEDGNSNKMNAASNTLLRLTTQVGQAHVATGVPLDLGTNTQPPDPRTQRNTKPRVYRPTPVRPVSTTGQTGPCW